MGAKVQLYFDTHKFVKEFLLIGKKRKVNFVWYFAHLLYKIFTLEQTNSFVSFSLNQIFHIFATVSLTKT